MFGLGKKRTEFGKWIDREGISQSDIESAAKLSRRTVSRLCNDFDYLPKYQTAIKIKRAVQKLGKDIPDNYLGM